MEAEDDVLVIYSYAGENWNLAKNERASLEGALGSFTIFKSALEESEVHIKRARKPHGCKGIQKKVITHTPNIASHIKNGKIVIDEFCGVDRKEFEETSSTLPRIIRNLLYCVFEYYMLHGVLPDKDTFIQ